MIDLRVRKRKMIYPSNVIVDINTELDNEYVGMHRREILYRLLFDRTTSSGAHLVNGTLYQLNLST
jgi:geranylgeranyl reductase